MFLVAMVRLRSSSKSLLSIPTWNRTRTWTLGESRAIRYTIEIWGRRLDLHQHDPVYKTGALLSRARSAWGPHAVPSRSAVIRTLSTRFGIWFLSQENTPVSRALSSGGARFDYDLSSAFQYASLINLDQLSILEACSE